MQQMEKDFSLKRNVKIYMYINTVKNIIYNYVYSGFEDWDFSPTTISSNLLYDIFFAIYWIMIIKVTKQKFKKS